MYDKLLLEIPEAAAQKAGEHVTMFMTNVRPGGVVLDVPPEADWGVTENWGDTH